MRNICLIFYLVLVINFLSASKVYQRNTLDGNQSIFTKRSSPETQDDCNLDIPSIPDFGKAGRRISETKCLEYIWEMEIREKSNFTACTKESGESGEKNEYNVSPGDFPHMGGIGWRTTQGTFVFKCACSLISDKFILTAAHCKRVSHDKNLVNAEPEIVRLGHKNLDYSNGIGPQDYKIIAIIVHPNYKAPKKYYDIALMKIETITKFTNNIQPACLWSEFDTTQLGASVTSTSWGVVRIAETTSLVFQAAVVDIIDTNQCDNLLRTMCNRHWCGIKEHQLCAGKFRCNVDACQKDIGGPLQVKIPQNNTIKGSIYNIIGVGSFGVSRPESDLPDVYTRVSSFIDWIESIVWSQN